MEKTWKWKPTAEEAADVEEAIKLCVAEMERATERVADDQAEIEKLKAETRAMLAVLQAT